MKRFSTEFLSELFPSISETQRGEQHWQIDDPSTYCGRCGAPVGPGSVAGGGCTFCVGKRLPWDQLVRLGMYRPPMDQWIVSMKFAHHWWRASWLGLKLAPFITSAACPGRTAVCPVPMHWLRRIHRGYNQAELIARAIAKHNKLRLGDVLQRVRYTIPQTRLATSKRQHNVRGSFALRDVDLKGWHIWLIDDVKTTGATLSGCARLLKRRGAARVSVAVAAVADAQNTHTINTATPPRAKEKAHGVVQSAPLKDS